MLVDIDDKSLVMTTPCGYTFDALNTVVYEQLTVMTPAQNVTNKADWALSDGSFIENPKVRLRDVVWPTWPPVLHAAFTRF